MSLGFVLVKVKPGREREVQRALMGVPGVQEVWPLFGEDDLIVKIEAPDFDELGRRIIGGVRRLAGVVRTNTLTVTRL